MSMEQFQARPRAAAAYLACRLKKAGQVTPYSGEARWSLVGRIKRVGQVTIELLLVLPVFLTLLFFIMEMGNMGFQTILAHHCAYELARIGSLVAGPTGAGSGGGLSTARMKMKNVLEKMFPNSPGVSVDCSLVPTLADPQISASGGSHMNEDLLVSLTYPAKLIFPVSSQALADPPKGRRIKTIVVMVRMPVEKPFFQ